MKTTVKSQFGDRINLVCLQNYSEKVNFFAKITSLLQGYLQ